MGLDMYLEKYPRIEGIDLQQIIAAEKLVQLLQQRSQVCRLVF